MSAERRPPPGGASSDVAAGATARAEAEAESAASLVGLAVLGDADAESLETAGTVGGGRALAIDYAGSPATCEGEDAVESGGSKEPRDSGFLSFGLSWGFWFGACLVFCAAIGISGSFMLSI